MGRPTWRRKEGKLPGSITRFGTNYTQHLNGCRVRIQRAEGATGEAGQEAGEGRGQEGGYANKIMYQLQHLAWLMCVAFPWRKSSRLL